VLPLSLEERDEAKRREYSLDRWREAEITMSEFNINPFSKAVSEARLLWSKQQDPESEYSFPVPDISVKTLFNQWVKKQPNRPYIQFNEREYSYEESNTISQKLANGITKLGPVKGDRLITFMLNGPEFLFVSLACFKLGVIIVNCNPNDTPREITTQILDSGACIAVADERALPAFCEAFSALEAPPAHVLVLAEDSESLSEALPNTVVVDYQQLIEENEAVEPAVEIDPLDIAVLQYTGGTTGFLKACCLSNRALIANGLCNVAFMEARAPRDEFSIIVYVPMSHGLGFNCALLIPICTGGKAILVDMSKFSIVTLLETIVETKPSVLPAIPTILNYIVASESIADYDISSVKAIVSGSAPLSKETKTKFESMTNAKITEAYGLSEACVSVLGTPFYKEDQAEGTVGIPYPNTEALIVDSDTGTQVLAPGESGEIIFRGPQMLSSYWRRPEETEASIRNGWFYTGDIGIMDEEGIFRILERKKDVIIMSGLNVYPREIDEILFTHPDINEACVIGVPDKMKGEVPVAFVVKKTDTELLEEEVITFCEKQLARFKLPRKIVFVDSIPKTKNNKSNRNALREMWNESFGGMN